MKLAGLETRGMRPKRESLISSPITTDEHNCGYVEARGLHVALIEVAGFNVFVQLNASSIIRHPSIYCM